MSPSSSPASPAEGPAPRSARALRRSWLPWIPLLLVVALALVAAAVGSNGPTTNEERVFAIAQTIKCPTCGGETVANSNAPVSQAIRIEIAKRVQAGQTDDEIRGYVSSTYTDAVLLTPTASGLTGLVWILPVVALVAALAGLAMAFRRWSEHAPVAASDADRRLVAAALEREHDGEGSAGRPDDGA